MEMEKKLSPMYLGNCEELDCEHFQWCGDSYNDRNTECFCQVNRARVYRHEAEEKHILCPLGEKCWTKMTIKNKILRGATMSKKEKLIEYINHPITTDARNRMGCSENWYNAYYAIKETFTIEEIQCMTDKEIENLVKLADEIGIALY